MWREPYTVGRERDHVVVKKTVKWIWKQEQALIPPFGPESKVSFQRPFMSTRPVARVISADINCLLTPKRFKIYQAESKGIWSFEPIRSQTCVLILNGLQPQSLKALYNRQKLLSKVKQTIIVFFAIGGLKVSIWTLYLPKKSSVYEYPSIIQH